MKKFTIKTRRLIILGVILLACVGVVVGKNEALLVAVGGLLSLLKGDDD
ncbi:MAG: hypothetical protein KAX30_04385 [Candidatus Atribacteria bacterium]|nr:hypothetical protein [Candidatus Atribacteria bacterium]